MQRVFEAALMFLIHALVKSDLAPLSQTFMPTLPSSSISALSLSPQISTSQRLIRNVGTRGETVAVKANILSIRLPSRCSTSRCAHFEQLSDTKCDHLVHPEQLCRIPSQGSHRHQRYRSSTLAESEYWREGRKSYAANIQLWHRHPRHCLDRWSSHGPLAGSLLKR